MGPYRTPGSVLADEPKKKLEKLTFTPTRVIEIERTGELDEDQCQWRSVLLKPGREVTFAPFRYWSYGDDWYIDCGRIYRVLHCDVERVYAQLSMEADVAAKVMAMVPVEPEYARKLDGYWVDAASPVAPLDMVSAVIASQVAAGGVDTDGTRAQAERWCAMLAGCVCEGMMATTWRSRYRETVSDYEGAVTAEIIDGHIAKPLGRP